MPNQSEPLLINHPVIQETQFTDSFTPESGQPEVAPNAMETLSRKFLITYTSARTLLSEFEIQIGQFSSTLVRGWRTL